MPVPDTYPGKVTKADFVAVAELLNEVETAAAPLAVVAYSPGTDSKVLMTTSTSFVAISTTLARATFVAPPSGTVTIHCDVMADINPGEAAFFGVLDGATTVVSAWMFSFNYAGSTNRWSKSWKVTGLTPGATYNYDFAARVGAAATLNLWAGPTFGPLYMEVRAA